MDIIADAFTIIRNAYRAKKEETTIPYSKVLLNIVELLKKEGYIENYKEFEISSLKKKIKTIKVYLKYNNKIPALSGIRRVSKQSQRVYLGYKEIKPILNGYGIGIFSTTQGILTDKEAKEKKVGGELIGIVF